MLEDAGYDAQRMLEQFDAAGMSATDQLLEIEKMVASTGLAMRNDLNPAAQATSAWSEISPTKLPTPRTRRSDLAEALDEATEAAEAFEDQFRDLMATILGEGEALLRAQELAAELDEIVAEMATTSVPDLSRAFYDMSVEVAARIGKLVDEGARLTRPRSGRCPRQLHQQHRAHRSRR